MKSLKTILRLSAIAAMCCTTVATHAFPVSKYATQSKLATGRWVKIAVPTNGVYEITRDELMQMGFNDINKVRIWGNGGHMINEVLNGTAIDDLTQISTTIIGDKLCFYGKGAVEMTFNNNNNKPSFSRRINAYSTQGYYFLSDTGQEKKITTIDAASQGNPVKPITTSFDYCYHEQELMTYGQSGKDLFGEEITNGGSVDFALPQVASTNLNINVTVAAKTRNNNATLVTTLTTGGKTFAVPFPSTTTTILMPSKSFNYYNQCSPIAEVVTSQPATTGKLNFSFTISGGDILQGNLDNFIITYERNNVIDESEHGQMRMAFQPLSTGDCVVLPDASASTRLWCINNTNEPQDYELTQVDNLRGCAPVNVLGSSQWVAFDPAQELLKISSFQEIENQNLHSMETPEMLIVTNKVFMEQAQRIVELHKTLGDVTAVVVDQEQIFNEFSSGTPDAMAIRLLCKMLYDRNNTKFKYLLMLGEGSYDNRGLTTVKKNRIITYQTDVSNHEDNSFTTDDFFAFLDDNSGERVASALVRLGVGRIPSSNELEARNDIDKLIKYCLAPDFGPWRNSTFYAAETGDDGMHQGQAENNSTLLTSTLSNSIEVNKVYIDMFQRDESESIITKETDRTSSNAHRALLNLLSRGQYYGCYVGHAGHSNFTSSKLWTTNDATKASYPHLPIFFTACCDVARYDSNQRGIAERMFHNPNGGAIALITTSREVYANSNELLNQAWIKNAFNWTETGKIPTMGEAYMKAKQNLGTMLQANRAKFFLMGDPTIKLAYPRPLFKITSINGKDVTTGATVTTQPLQSVQVTAQVLKTVNGELDTDFTGDATITIYDRLKQFKTVAYNKLTVDLYYPRDILVQVQGRVTNGIFTGTAVLPRHCRAIGENGMVTVYAHKDGTDLMVNGSYNNLLIGEYNGTSVTDDEQPTITSMFLNNEETFENGMLVPANSTLYIHATDNLAINTQSMSMGNNMRLVLDGGKTSFSQALEYSTTSDEGRSIDIRYPLNDMDEGEHSLAFTVHDAAGNATTRTISFVVANPQQLALGVEELPATTAATITATNFNIDTPVNLKVTDALGNLVWTQQAQSFPVTWNLNDAKGQRVKSGIYKVYGNYTTGSLHGGSNVATILVLDSINR